MSGYGALGIEVSPEQWDAALAVLSPAAAERLFGPRPDPRPARWSTPDRGERSTWHASALIGRDNARCPLGVHVSANDYLNADEAFAMAAALTECANWLRRNSLGGEGE